jgi:hypothetical protein
MRTIKIDGEIVELPQTLPDHPYFHSQGWSRKRNREIYGMYVSDEKITLAEVAAFWGISGSRAGQIIRKIALIIKKLEAGEPYYGQHASDARREKPVCQPTP